MKAKIIKVDNVAKALKVITAIGNKDYKAIRRFWEIKPYSNPHSSEKGTKGYDRKNKSWKDE